LPERGAIEPKTCTPAYFERFLSRRFSEGNKSVRLLFAEVKKQGYTGSYSHLARYIAPSGRHRRDATRIAFASIGVVSLRRSFRRANT
jgi:hypothetical protein